MIEHVCVHRNGFHSCGCGATSTHVQWIGISGPGGQCTNKSAQEAVERHAKRLSATENGDW